MHKTAISFLYFLLLWYQVKGFETLLPFSMHSGDTSTSPLKFEFEKFSYTQVLLYILLLQLHQDISACLIPIVYLI